MKHLCLCPVLVKLLHDKLFAGMMVILHHVKCFYPSDNMTTYHINPPLWQVFIMFINKLALPFISQDMLMNIINVFTINDWRNNIGGNTCCN